MKTVTTPLDSEPTLDECLVWLHELHGDDKALDDIDDWTSGNWGSSSIITKLKKLLQSQRRDRNAPHHRAKSATD